MSRELNRKQKNMLLLEDKIEHIENTYQPIGLVTLYLKEPKQSLRRLKKQMAREEHNG